MKKTSIKPFNFVSVMLTASLIYSGTCFAQTVTPNSKIEYSSDVGSIKEGHASSEDAESFNATKGSTTKGNTTKPASEGTTGEALGNSNPKDAAFDTKNEQVKPDGSKGGESHSTIHLGE